MYKTSNYVIFDVDISFAVKEGDLSYTEDAIGDNGTTRTWALTAPMKKGDFVELVPDERLTVTKATGDKPIFGELISNPEWVSKTRFPKDNRTDGEYPRRRATVRIYGAYIHELPLVESNTAIQSGDYLAYDADEGKFDKTSTKTDCIALEPINALENGRIATVMGFFGGLTE
ncbi:MAG: hypothetical protein HUJ56_11680 [Erysipelotrichaceae bacterium]|nr:hypothetical protein [Erysipelotrichaceae bacterium]